MIKICVLGSGSEGNCTYLNFDGYELLIDAGFSHKETKRRLESVNIDIANINSVLISHQHKDHVQAIPVFRKKGVKIYSELDKNIISEKPVLLENNNIKIIPFRLSHDQPCIGFRVEYQAFSLVYALDSGCIPELALKHMFNATAVLLEFNYDLIRLTENQKYSTELIERVASGIGHLDNADAARILKHINHDKLELVLGMHLSELNNHPDLVQYEIKNVIRAACDYNVASQSEPTKIYYFM